MLLDIVDMRKSRISLWLFVVAVIASVWSEGCEHGAHKVIKEIYDKLELPCVSNCTKIKLSSVSNVYYLRTKNLLLLILNFRSPTGTCITELCISILI